MTSKSAALSTVKLEKRDIFIDGKCKTIRIAPAVWKAFLALAVAAKVPSNKLAQTAQRDCNGTLAQAIEAYVRKWSDEPIYTHGTRNQWLDALVDLLRPVFAGRGYPLPANIKATMGFPSKGWRGKARGECWPASRSRKGWCEIFIHPCESDPLSILNILTHELAHAWQDGAGHKMSHGKTFIQCGKALDLEGKPAHMMGGAVWAAWAAPLLADVGDMPHGALDEFEAKQKKQTTRMLKCECPECGAIWRTSSKVVAQIIKRADDQLITPRMACVDLLCEGRIILNADDAEGGDEEE